jgi:hypothetical protein
MNSGIASKDIFAKDAERRTEQFVVVVFNVIGVATTLRFAFHFPVSSDSLPQFAQSAVKGGQNDDNACP